MGPAAAPIMIGLTIASAVATATSQVVAANARAKEAKSRAEIEKYNQEVANEAAADAIKRGKVEEDRQRTITALEIGGYRAGAAGRGLLVDEGSESEREGDIAAAGEYDAKVIKQNAQREAARFRAQGVNNDLSGQAFKQAASSAITAGGISAGASLVGGGASVAGKWNTAFNTGGTS